MLDIKIIRENPQKIQEAAKAKNVDIDVQHILEIDQKQRELSVVVQALREERNTAAKDRDIQRGKDIKNKLEKEEAALRAVDEELQIWLGRIPNPSKDDVKVGKDDTENDVIRKHKEPTNLTFTPKDHLEIGEKLDIIDVQQAAKVSGARFYYLKNEGVMLELALVQLAMETLMKEGFSPIIPPVLIKKETMKGMGYMENGGEEDMFKLADNELFLVGTAEQSLVPLQMDTVIKSDKLPLRYVGYSPAFRREAGSYGKDTKGIIRVHQFDKVEMVTFVEEGKDDEEHEYLLGIEEKFFQMLDLPYQVIKMCTGDLGFPAARKYDLEAWIPSQGKYREVTSVSTVTDFQSRRLNIKYEKDGKKQFASVLNGTAFAIGRTIVAILENYQQEDGSVIIPEALRKYMGKDIISPR